MSAISRRDVGVVTSVNGEHYRAFVVCKSGALPPINSQTAHKVNKLVQLQLWNHQAFYQSYSQPRTIDENGLTWGNREVSCHPSDLRAPRGISNFDKIKSSCAPDAINGVDLWNELVKTLRGPVAQILPQPQPRPQSQFQAQRQPQAQPQSPFGFPPLNPRPLSQWFSPQPQLQQQAKSQPPFQFQARPDPIPPSQWPSFQSQPQPQGQPLDDDPPPSYEEVLQKRGQPQSPIPPPYKTPPLYSFGFSEEQAQSQGFYPSEEVNAGSSSFLDRNQAIDGGNGARKKSPASDLSDSSAVEKPKDRKRKRADGHPQPKKAKLPNHIWQPASPPRARKQTRQNAPAAASISVQFERVFTTQQEKRKEIAELERKKKLYNQILIKKSNGQGLNENEAQVCRRLFASHQDAVAAGKYQGTFEQHLWARIARLERETAALSVAIAGL